MKCYFFPYSKVNSHILLIWLSNINMLHHLTNKIKIIILQVWTCNCNNFCVFHNIKCYQWSTSFPFVSPFSNHSTVTLLASGFRPLITAECMRPRKHKRGCRWLSTYIGMCIFHLSFHFLSWKHFFNSLHKNRMEINGLISTAFSYSFWIYHDHSF